MSGEHDMTVLSCICYDIKSCSHSEDVTNYRQRVCKLLHIMPNLLYSPTTLLTINVHVAHRYAIDIIGTVPC